MSKEVILTGLRSNGLFHLGNYLGAIKPIVDLQHKNDKYKINMFVPDLHSFTTPEVHSLLYQQTIDNLIVYVAAGLDLADKNTIIYRQSFVSAHSELTWILGCFSYYGELKRMTQFKEKSLDLHSENNENLFNENVSISAGLFMYPVLMAADILLYGAKWVPVGDDQRQHLELSRDLAIRFNNKFGETFNVPNEWKKQLEFIKRNEGARIRSLKNPEKKMSKSISDPAGTINLQDDPLDAAKKIMSATTDSKGYINLDWENQPGISNLIQIQSLLNNKTSTETLIEWSGNTNYGDLKKTVAESVSKFIINFQHNLKQISKTDILNKLKQDEIIANKIANSKLLEVQKAVGLRI